LRWASRLYIRLSVKCMNCDKTKETCPHSYTSVVRHSLACIAVHKWFVWGVPFHLKLWTKVTHPGDFQSIFARSTSSIRPSEISSSRKRGDYECIATWGRPMARQSFSALITTPMPSLKSLNLSIARIAVLLRFCCSHTTLRCDLDLWPCNLDRWPWTFASYRLWRDETLYQIWTQSSNPRRSYCDFNIWPYDLEHVLRVALGSGIIFTNFDFRVRQLLRAWIIAFFDANTLCHAVILTFDLLTLNFYSTSGVMRLNSVQNLSEIE